MSKGFKGHLTAKEQEYSRIIIGYIESYQSEWVFYNADFDSVYNTLKAVLQLHPEYFWVTAACTAKTVTRGSQTTLTLKPEMNEYIGGVPEMRRRFDRAVDAFITEAKKRSSALYEQILYLHDLIVINTDYVLNAKHCYDAYGCLVNRRAVCAGYAAAFQVLMQKLGVECGRTEGWRVGEKSKDPTHEWNYIRLSDGYCFVDVTWDDPVIYDSSCTDNLTHDFFCLDLNELRLTHIPSSDQFIPGAYGTKYNYYRYNGWELARYSFAAASALAERQLRTSDTFYIKFGSERETKAALKDLIDARRVYSIPGMSTRSITYNVSKSGLILSVQKR